MKNSGLEQKGEENNITTILVFTYGFTNRIFVLTKNAVYL